MKPAIARPSLSLLAGFWLTLLSAACGETPPPTVSLTVSPDRFPSGGTTQATVTVTDFELVAEDTAHTHELAKAHESSEGEEHTEVTARSGHYHIYLDELETNPLVMSSDPVSALTVTASAGAHRLIVRLHGLDHKIVEPQVTDEAAITIE